MGLIEYPLFEQLLFKLFERSISSANTLRDDIICIDLVSAVSLVNSDAAADYDGHTVLRLEFKP